MREISKTFNHKFCESDRYQVVPVIMVRNNKNESTYLYLKYFIRIRYSVRYRITARSKALPCPTPNKYRNPKTDVISDYM